MTTFCKQTSPGSIRDLKRSIGIVYETSHRWIEAGKKVGIVGGDHSSPLGAIRAAAEHNPGMGILHIDAHADLREAYEGFTYSHASIMYNVLHELPDVSKIVQVGIRDLL